MMLKQITTASIAVLVTMSLAACGGDSPSEQPEPAITASGPSEVPADDETTDDAPASESPADDASTDDTAEQSTPPADDSSDAEEVPANGPDLVAGSIEDATMARTLAVQHIAEEEGPDGIVIAQDLEDRSNRWDVDVLVGDTVFEVKVNTSDGSTRTDDREGADGDDRDAAAASFTIADAIEAALAEVPGIVEDASWDDDDRAGWQIDVVPEGGTDDEVEIDIDPSTGEILSIDD